MNNKNKIFTILADRKVLYRILAFIISVIVLLLIFLFNKMNGKDYLVIRSDFLDSIGAYKEFIRDIFSRNSIYYCNSTGLGLNNAMTVSAMFNPFNLLYIVFSGCSFNFITTISLLLRVGFAALSFQIFSDSIIKNNKFSSVIISVFYSLNAYTIEYGTIHNGWIDVLIIMPLLCASIIKCIEDDRRVNVIILYTILFLSNYYMGYMIGFFTLLFIVFYLFIIYEKKTEHPFKECLTKFFNWFLCAVIAVMLSAFIWVPTLFFLASNRVPDSSEIMELKVSVLQILNSLFWGTSYGIEGTYAYIYCGIPVFMFLPMFFLNKRIEKKWKLFYGLLAAILLLSMVSNRLNSFWHVFDQPDDFWYRYSFLLCFCLCVIASVEIKYFDETEKGKLLYIILGLSFFYQLILHTVSLWTLEVGVLNTNYGFIINLVFMILWGAIMYFASDVRARRIVCAILSIIIMAFELVSNSKRQISNLVSAEPYYTWTGSVEKTVEEINAKDQGFYRMIIAENDNSYNSDLYFGFNGIGDFGNQEKYSVRTFLSNIGFGTSTRVTCENGFNPVANMLLGIKYELNAPNIDYKPGVVVLSEDEDGAMHKEPQKANTTYNINENVLNLGYLSAGDIILYEYSGRNVFKNMNEIVISLSGINADCYVPFPKDKIIYDSNNIVLSEMDTGDMVFERNGEIGEISISIPKGKYEEAYIQFEISEPGIFGYDYYVENAQNGPNILGNRLGVSSAIKMDTDDEHDQFTITIGSYGDYSSEMFVCDNINIYYLDEDNLQTQYNELSKNQLMLSDYSNGHVEGRIHVDGDKRLLVTTIPYDPGWKAYINGIEAEPIRVIDGAFMAVWLPGEGEYNVTFDFECPGLKIGIIISICGLVAFLSVIFEKKIKIKKE